MNRDQALTLLKDWVKNPSLRAHMLAVEAGMHFYARRFGEDEELWGLAGLLHDADWEKYPDEHPQQILDYLRQAQADRRLIQAINAHGGQGAIEPASLMDKTLFACDEASGFIIAVAKVRPDRLKGMTASSVKKKLKDKAFAAAVSRSDITGGAELLSLSLDDHLTNLIAALQPLEAELLDQSLLP